MPTLNRFPLLGLWAKEAALRLGHGAADAEAIGHAYAVLYAIRAQGPPKAKHGPADGPGRPAAGGEEPELLDFGGDRLEVRHTASGALQGVVGRGTPQTGRTYRSHVRAKFPADYYGRLEEAFRAVWEKIDPQTMHKGRLVYQRYDQWKKTCGAPGRLVDLDKLLEWCREQSG